MKEATIEPIRPEWVCHQCLGFNWDGAVCPDCDYSDGTVVVDGNALRPGTVVGGHYVVGLVLGYPGGFGITYRGRDLRDRSKVAIKEYMPSQLAGRSNRSDAIMPLGEKYAQYYAHGLMRFRQESETLQALNHPSIVKVADFFEENATAYLVMPLVDGVTLSEYTERVGGRIPFNVAINIMTPVMDALRHAHGHDKRLIHRDVSPENIYISADSRVVLLDFGAARSPLPGLALTSIMKLGFSPPEVIRGQPQGPFTDVYGVAATLYTITTGAEPPLSIDREEGEVLASPSNLGVKMDKQVENTLLRGMALRPSERPQSILELQSGLYPVKASPPVTPNNQTPPIAFTAPSYSSAVKSPSKPRYTQRLAFWAMLTVGIAIIFALTMYSRS